MEEQKSGMIVMIAFLLAFVLYANIVSATEQIQLGVPTNLQFSCTVNYAIPSASATYNISIFYPNGSTLINNQLTNSKGQGNFNYTTTFPVAGKYKVLSFCYDGTNGNYSSEDYYEVTRFGDELTDAKSNLYIVFIIAIIFSFLLCLYGAIKIPLKNQRDYNGNIVSVNDLKYVKVFLMVMCYMMLLLFFGLTQSILNNYISASGISQFFEVGYWLMLNGLWAAIPITFVYLIITFFDDKKIDKMISRGFDVQ